MIEGRLVRLRGLELTDLDKMWRLFNNQDVQQFLMLVAPASKEEEEQFIRSSWEQRQKKTDFIFAIEILEEKEYIGNVGTFIKAFARTRLIQLGAKNSFVNEIAEDMMTNVMKKDPSPSPETTIPSKTISPLRSQRWSCTLAAASSLRPSVQESVSSFVLPSVKMPR